MTRKFTDFCEILTELRDWGINDYEMERRTGIGRSSLSKLRTGDRKQPNYDDGVEIMRIYQKEKRKEGA